MFARPASSILAVPLGIVGLFYFTDTVRRHAGGSEGQVVERIVPIKSEIRAVFVPQSLIDFARRHRSIKDHEEFASLLASEGMGDLWYVTVASVLLSDGVIRRGASCIFPGKMTHVFADSMAVLETLRGDPKADRPNAYSGARVSIIPESVAKLEPASIIEDLVEKAR